MVKVNTLLSWDTELSADSVEWCPFPSKHQLLVCGTYQLIEGENQLTSSRHGRLHLLSFVDLEEKELARLQSIDMPAVLDCKWAPELIHNEGFLAVANAAGQLCLFKLSHVAGNHSKDELVAGNQIGVPKQGEEGDVLALALDWSLSEDLRIAVSDSKGRISIFRMDTTGLCVEYNWTAHQFEAWTVYFDPFTPNICYTGGDDATLRVYDLREDLHSAKLSCRQHSAGVTSFATRRQSEHQLLSGSYDEQILLWDTRQMKRSIRSTNTGGGVWRMRFNPETEDMLLAACMYNGFHILDKDLAVVVKYQEHTSIAYGAHWSNDRSNVIATCSFYDHKLNVSLLNKD